MIKAMDEINIAKYSANLKCTKCLDRIISPFEQCVNNVFVCERCKWQQLGIDTNFNVQNINEENLYTQLNICYQNSEEFCQFDCGVRAPLRDLVEHENFCYKRNWPSSCYIESCNWSGLTSSLISHMEDEHPENLAVCSNDSERAVKISIENPVVLAMIYEKSYYFNDLYWVRLLEERNKRYVVVQRQGGIGNIQRQKMEEFMIFVTSIPGGNKGKIIEAGYRDDTEMKNLISTHKTEVTNIKGDTLKIFLKEKESEIVSDSLMTKLACPICFGLLCGLIFICSNGHSICGICRIKILNDKCSICKAKMLSIRNRILENVTNNCLVECVFSEQGCREIFQAEKLNDHILNCTFRRTYCLYHCGWSGTVASLYDHFNTNHGNRRNIPESNKMFLHVYHIFGRTFIYKYFYTTVYAFRIEELTFANTSEFTFKIDFKNPVTGYTIGFTAPCSTWGSDSNTSILPRDMGYFHIDKNAFILNLCNNNDTFSMNLYVYKNISSRS